ncbi:MAG: exodeoxyribonuclease VII small subunit [Bacilli bacterium]|nr:exodeoxyribonuclease VII small subunit [Bacilli bacterium]
MVKKEISFEEKLKQLEKIVRELESGDVNLDDAIDKFNEAMKLAKECSDKLTNVEQQVNKILTSDDKLVDFDLET